MNTKAKPKKKSKARSKQEQDAYLELVRQFPLRPVRSDHDLDEAIRIIDALLDRDALDPGEKDYLDVLSDLVNRYETENHPMAPLADAEMLTHLIEAKGVNQALVARGAGITESTISEILSGKRTLNRSQIGKLAQYFSVAPGVFRFHD